MEPNSKHKDSSIEKMKIAKIGKPSNNEGNTYSVRTEIFFGIKVTPEDKKILIEKEKLFKNKSAFVLQACLDLDENKYNKTC